jgi:hypothetical protein
MQIKIKVKRTKKRDSGRIPLLIFIIVTFAFFLFLSFLRKAEGGAENKIAPKAKSEEVLPQNIQDSSPPLDEKKETIRSGETLPIFYRGTVFRRQKSTD